MVRSEEKGTSAVEFALVLPLLVLLLFSIIEFALLLYDKAVITNACREGARYAILFDSAGPKPASEIQEIVLQYAQDHLITFGADVLDATDVKVEPFGTKFRKVTATYSYQFLVLPKFATSLTGALNLSSEAVMRLEEG